MKTIYKTTLLMLFVSVFVLSGCSSQRPAPPKVYWPPPPAEPQMEWIVTYSSDDNFPKSDQQLAAEKFLGKPQFVYFSKPTGVASRGDGVLYVSDMDAGQIRVVDFNKNTSSWFLEQSPLGLPIGLAFDSTGNLYVADAHNKYIVQFNGQREIVRNLGAGELDRPTFIALDESRGRLYVSDVLKHQVLAFDLRSGAKLFSFGGAGRGAGKLFGPQGIAIDREGRIFVAEQLNARIQVFDTEGRHLYMFGKRGDRSFDFEGPRGIAFDSKGNLYVAEARKSALLVFKQDGTPLTGLGGGGAGPHLLGFTLPTGVSVDRNDRIYISDGMNRRVTIWQLLTPGYLATHPLDVESLRRIEEKVQRMQKN